MLGTLVLAGALLAGYGMAGSKSRNWVHTSGFVVLRSVTVYLILDLEFPRMGLIRIIETDNMLRSLRKDPN